MIPRSFNEVIDIYHIGIPVHDAENSLEIRRGILDMKITKLNRVFIFATPTANHRNFSRRRDNQQSREQV